MAQSLILTRLKWGARWGAYFGLALTAWVVVLFLLRGDEPFKTKGVTFLGVVALYMTTGPVAGAIVGLLRPLTASIAGAIFTGIIAGIPVSFGAVVLMLGLSPWTQGHTVVLTTMAVSLGGLCGYMFRQFLYEPE